MTEIQEILDAQNFTQYGYTSLERPFSIDIYRQWLDEGHHGEMGYLREHLEKKESPQKLMAMARSAIVVTEAYLPHPYPMAESPSELRTALYARGADYHHWLKEKLEKTIAALKAKFSDEEFVSWTDSGPVLERDLAYRAGLGWIGKNTCLIDEKKGSLNFIGEIYTSLKLEGPEIKAPDRCGNCTRCIDICPTDAIIDERKIDARKCISYLTIENKGNPSEELREEIGDWFFGCDLCQTVCPWNQKIWRSELNSENKFQREELVVEIKAILQSSNKKLLKRFQGSPLSRAGARGLKRNAIIVAANKDLDELLPEISALKEDEPFREICEWAMKKLVHTKLL